MYVVAYLYNTNGMASWCWEAAHALAEAGLPVALACTKAVALPGEPAFEVVRVDDVPTVASRKGRLRRELFVLDITPRETLELIHSAMLDRGYSPAAYLLNQTDLVNPAVKVPQHVVAWAYPPGIAGYLLKAIRLRKITQPIQFVRGILGDVAWYRKDWRGYRDASSVLAVTKPLADWLKASGIDAAVVHPGTGLSITNARIQDTRKTRLLITAAGLDDPRKGVRWMLKSLSAMDLSRFQLTLVGHSSPALEVFTRSMGIPAVFAGWMNRDAIRAELPKHDVFLFASRSDDWGYVLIEAMGAGMHIIAPRQYPFDLIVGEAGALFEPGNTAEFVASVASSANDKLATGNLAKSRADKLFSRHAFAKSLMEACMIRPATTTAVCA